jgi:hypothetical protein
MGNPAEVSIQIARGNYSTSVQAQIFVTVCGEQLTGTYLFIKNANKEG